MAADMNIHFFHIQASIKDSKDALDVTTYIEIQFISANAVNEKYNFLQIILISCQ